MKTESSIWPKFPRTTIQKKYTFDYQVYMTNRESILAILRANKSEFRKLGVTSIGLFGSYIRNEQSPHSDIDLLVDFMPEKENFDNYMAIYDKVESLFGGERVEIVTMNGLSKYIGPKILKEIVYA